MKRIRNISWRSLTALAMLTVALLPTGCLTELRKGVDVVRDSLSFGSQSDRNDKSKAAVDPNAKGTAQVKIDGSVAMLSEDLGSTLPSNQFVKRIKHVVETRGQATAIRWIHRYPDAAFQSLRESSTSESSDPVLILIAKAHEQQCCQQRSSSWSRLLAERTARPKEFQQYERRRSQFFESLKSGQIENAISLNLTQAAAKTQNQIVEIDALQSTAMAWMLADRPDQAIAAGEQAITKLGATQPYWQAHLFLLLSEVQRRTEQFDRSIDAWTQAVEICSQLLLQPIPVTDPVIWGQFIEMHPYKAQWPAIAQRGLQHVSTTEENDIVLSAHDARPNVKTLDPALLWRTIGTWRFERDEPQAALVAFKRAEVFVSDTTLRDKLRLDQARSLVRLNQHQAATAILAVLSQSPEPNISLPAYAMLGTMKLQTGTPQQGLHLLRRAVESDEATTWPRRIQAEADLGIAYLLLGDETNGFRWLHHAQDQFRSRNETDQLMKCLSNEAQYLEHIGKDRDAKHLRKQVAALTAKRAI